MCRRIVICIALIMCSRALGQSDIKDLAHDLAASNDKLATLESQERLALLRYHPIYFIYGNPESKAQISFRFLLVRTVPLYVAYTQIIFWRLQEKSRPFHDATYNPEIFYRWSFANPHFASVDISPWSHHSNGKADEASRSVDESFVRLNTRWSFSDLTLLLSGSAAFHYNEDDTNRDLYEYRSPFEFQASLINFFAANRFIDKGDLTFRFFPGGQYGERWKTGGYELGYNFRFGALDVFPMFYIQYYQGYAESLINYNENVRQFRGGVSF